MSKVVDEVLTAVILMERVMPRLHENTRETISRSHLQQVYQTLTMVLRQLNSNCEDPLVLTPIMEVVTLIDTIVVDGFVETDDETKQLIVDKLHQALDQLYLFSGKFYMSHEFTWSMTKTDVLRHIVESCLDLGFYFGYDKQISTSGA